MGNFARMAYRNPTGTLQRLLDEKIALPRSLSVSELSRMLHRLLDAHLNGGPADPSVLRTLAEIFHQADGDDGAATAAGDMATAAHTLGKTELVPELLCVGYEVWMGMVERWGRSLPGTETRIQVRAHWKWSDAPSTDPLRQKLNAFCRRAREALGPFCREFVIHGSYSDGRTTPFSDLDTWMVLRREVLRDPQALEEVRRGVAGLLRIIRIMDPLQHHGIFIATEPDLEAYVQSRFPAVLLDTSTSILGAPPLDMRLVDDTVERAHALFAMASTIRDACADASEAPYRVKLLASWVMLLPAIHHQFHREPIYKPDAYPRVRKDFSTEAWIAVEAATELRRRWGEGEPASLLKRIDPRFHVHAARLAEEALTLLDAADVNDANWDGVDPSKKADGPCVTRHPARYNGEDFREVLSSRAARLMSVPGAVAVYAAGGVQAPTEGISDLDLVVVFREEPSVASVAALPYGAGIMAASPLADYIQCHESVVATEDGFPDLEAYWGDGLHLVAGAELRRVNGTSRLVHDPAIMATVRLFREGYPQMIRLMELRDSEPLDLRSVLLRAHSVVHGIEIARGVHGFHVDSFDEYVRRLRFLRTSWFRLKERERTTLAAQYPRIGALILYSILVEVSRSLLNLGLVTTAPLETGHLFRQNFFGRDVVFMDRADNLPFPERRGTVALPLVALPVIGCCFPGMVMEPQPPFEELGRCLAPGFMKACARIGVLFGKSMMFQRELLKATGNLKGPGGRPDRRGFVL